MKNENKLKGRDLINIGIIIGDYPNGKARKYRIPCGMMKEIYELVNLDLLH